MRNTICKRELKLRATEPQSVSFPPSDKYDFASIEGNRVRVRTSATLRNAVTRMQGRTEYHRLRVGDWRVVFVPGKELMTIAAIGPRGGISDR